MNVLTAAVDETGIRIGPATLPLPAVRLAACRAADVRAIGIRPEDVSLTDPGAGAALSAEVYVVEPMGNETFVDLRIDGERLTVRAPRGFTAPIGSTIGATFDPANACFFNEAGMTVVHRAPNKGEVS
jgi:multiple sugar transport system ATP-binding protein